MCCAGEPDELLDITELKIDRCFRKQNELDYTEFRKRYRRAAAARRARDTTDATCNRQGNSDALLPVEKAARGTERPRFLDRMPCRARAEPLTPALSVFETFSRDAGAPRGVSWASVRSDGTYDVQRQPTTEEWQQYQQLCKFNVTCFTELEKLHPINVFEQRDVCSFCGAERFRTTSSTRCCHGGALLLHHSGSTPNYPLPQGLLDMLTSNPGLSKQSRAGNDLFRFAQFALPKGTHRIPDSFKHLKVTGIPYATVPNLNEMSSTRSFLDDPYLRLNQREFYDRAVRPTDAQVEALDSILRSENCLVRQVVNWAEASQTVARLLVKWEGTTTSVRAFTVSPESDVSEPRKIFFTRRDEDEPCVLSSTDPMYAPMMWPLAFPSGEPTLLADGTPVDQSSNFSIQDATLAMLLQPERDANGVHVTLPTLSPYGSNCPPVPRRFSRFEMMGRLGDEFMLDRWLGVLDQRLKVLSSKNPPPLIK